MEERKEKGKRGHDKVGDAGDATFPIRQVWRMQKKGNAEWNTEEVEKVGRHSKKAGFSRFDYWYDRTILGEAYIRHIFSIYSAYIGTRRQPRGKQVDGKKQMTHAGWRVSSVGIMLRRTGLCLHRKEDKPNQREDLRMKCRERYRCQDRQLQDRTRTRKHHKCTLPY